MTSEYEHLKRCVDGLKKAIPRVQGRTITVPQYESWVSLRKICWSAFYRAEGRGTPPALLQPYRTILQEADHVGYLISSVGKPGRPRKKT